MCLHILFSEPQLRAFLNTTTLRVPIEHQNTNLRNEYDANLYTGQNEVKYFANLFH